MADARTTQLVVEALATQTDARTTQLVVEALATQTDVRTTQVVVEAMALESVAADAEFEGWGMIPIS